METILQLTFRAGGPAVRNSLVDLSRRALLAGVAFVMSGIGGAAMAQESNSAKQIIRKDRHAARRSALTLRRA